MDFFTRLRTLLAQSEIDLKKSKTLMDRMRPADIDDAAHEAMVK